MAVQNRVAFVVLTGIFGLYVIVSNDITVLSWDVTWLMKENQTSEPPTSRSIRFSPPRASLPFSECVLREYDPLHGEIRNVVNPKYTPLKGCNRSFRPITRLENGRIFIDPQWIPKVDRCQARCITFLHENTNKLGEWWNVNETIFECDVVESICYNGKAVMENYLHSQVIDMDKKYKDPLKNSELKKKPENVFKPDVYIILIDAVAATQAKRSLPKTLNFLTKNMSAISFEHLNKVGDNSRPNGYAFTMGWRITDSDRSLTGGSFLNTEHTWAEVCNRFRDNDSVIFKEYEKRGYKTMLAEDYYQGTLYTWPKCKGFDKRPTTNYYRPFLLQWNMNKSIKKLMSIKNCIEPYEMMMDYTEKFIRSHQDSPKFSLSWAATLSHDDANMLYHTDGYFERFFRNNEEKLRNAFVFFMGDHGMRVGKTRMTELGEVEVNNPFLVMTVPERLRSNQKLMENLRINSKRLIHQFDVYATLVDIMKESPKSNFTKFGYVPILKNNTNNATSILRDLGPYYERNCNNIPTDSSYCLCDHPKEDVNNEAMKQLMSHYFVEHINQMLIRRNVSHKCATLSLERVISLKAYKPVDKTDLYQVEFETVPGKGHFKANMLYNNYKNVMQRVGSLQRTNMYGKRGNCVQEAPYLKEFCYCKT